jgi:hypothetical protein
VAERRVRARGLVEHVPRRWRSISLR